MLSSGTMDEFITEEEEPWYDQQDLEQGKNTGPPWPASAASCLRLLAPTGPLNKYPLCGFETSPEGSLGLFVPFYSYKTQSRSLLL